MPTARTSVAVAAAPNGKLYAVGGLTPDGLLSAALEEYDPATDSWVARASMSVARTRVGFAVAPNGKLYAVGGFTGFSTNLVEEYDPSTNIWQAKAPMPTARFEHGLAVGANGKLYAVGGLPGGGPPVLMNTVEEYDPATNTWRGATQGVAQTLTPRALHSLTAAPNGKLYAIGGRGTPSPTNLVEEYDPATNVWRGPAQGIAQMPTARLSHAASLAPNGKLYVIGGSGSGGPLALVEEFDPVQNVWRGAAQGLAPMPTAREAIGLATAPNGKLYAIGGASAAARVGTNEEYDPVANAWSLKPARAPLPNPPAVPRNAAASAVAGGRLYVLGGANGSGTPLADVHEYTPNTNTWRAVDPMPTARYGAAAATAPNGRIYVVGGVNSGGNRLALLEEFTPPANGVGVGSWRTAPAVAQPAVQRLLHGFALAPNGRLYAVGGFGAPPGGLGAGPLREVEEFNPVTDPISGVTGAWRAVNSMAVGRYAFGFATAGDGRLYAVGGDTSTNDTSPVTTVERFTPPAGSFTLGAWAGPGGIAPLPAARSYFEMIGAQNGNLYAVGGFTPGAEHGDVFEYDHLANVWATRAAMPTARHGMSLGLVGNRLFAVAGFNGGTLAVNEEAVFDTLPTNVSAGGPYTVTANGSATVTADASDPDGDPLTYAWDLDGDLIYETPGKTVTLSGVGLTVGDVRTIRVRALDPKGGYALASTTATVIPPSCSPQRPNVGLTTSKGAAGHLVATLTARTNATQPTNALSSIRITRIDNAAVTVDGSPVAVGQTVSLATGTQQATMLVERRAPAQNPGLGSTVAFVVSDTCGSWNTFVGGGPSAF